MKGKLSSRLTDAIGNNTDFHANLYRFDFPSDLTAKKWRREK
jgi:hypothetical protein